MKEYLDQIHSKVILLKKPERIVSLVPSQTELLFDLGLEDKVVGVTRFCIHPKEKVKQIAKVGGTKDFSIKKIGELKPDLILANREENTKAGIEALRLDFPVWTSDIETLEHALDMIERIAELCEVGGSELSSQIKKQFSQLQPTSHVKGLYLIWRKPYMAAGQDTFISDMMGRVGIVNCCIQNRYPVLTEAQIQQLNPQHILLSSEPYPFTEKHVAELSKVCPSSQIKLVDGEMFSWYGSRMLEAAKYFKDFWK